MFVIILLIVMDIKLFCFNIARIKENEQKCLWDAEVEDNPPSIVLTPDKVDYLNKKISSRGTRFWMGNKRMY